MASEYTYDEEGETWPYFVMAVLTFVLLPATLAWVRRAFFAPRDAPAINAATPGAVRHCEHSLGLRDGGAVAAFQTRQRAARVFNKTLAFVVCGWAAVAYIARHHVVAAPLIGAFDPYEILDILAFALEREVKSRYRKLLVQFHPDKLARDLTQAARDEAEAAFIQINLAYKLLTDEVTRNNFLRYGHPDGPQEVKHGIALPKFLVEGRYSPLMVVVYFLLVGGVLPAIVGLWWNNVKTHTKRGLHIDTAGAFTRRLADRNPRQVVTPYEVLDWVCAAERLDRDLVARYLRGEPLAAALAAVARLPPLIDGLIELAIVFRQVDICLAAADLQKAIAQAVPAVGRQQELLQLPYVRDDAVTLQRQVNKLGKLFVLPRNEQKRVLGIDSDAELDTALDVAAHIPTLRVLDARFVVPGEEVHDGDAEPTVPPGANAHLCVKFVVKSPRHKSCPEVSDHELADPQLMDFLRNPLKTNDEQPQLPFTYSPHFPVKLRNKWLAFLVQQRDNQLVEGSALVALENASLANLELTPEQFVKGDGVVVSSFRMPMAAPTPSITGDFHFRLVLKNNGYYGCDVDIPVKMVVAAPAAKQSLMTKKMRKLVEVDDSESEEDSESDISDPEEDSLAGALAALRGGNVKKPDAPRTEAAADDESDFTDINTDTEAEE